MRLRVDIRRKAGLSDPEGVTTHRALQDLGYSNVASTHFGRTIFLDVHGEDTAAVTAEVDTMCRRLLANPVIEDYTIEVID